MSHDHRAVVAAAKAVRACETGDDCACRDVFADPSQWCKSCLLDALLRAESSQATTEPRCRRCSDTGWRSIGRARCDECVAPLAALDHAQESQ
jgi:hypothetical protein